MPRPNHPASPHATGVTWGGVGSRPGLPETLGRVGALGTTAPRPPPPCQVKLLKCLVDNIVVDISFNQLGGLCTLMFLEEIDRVIAPRHLFKKSIILVRGWCDKAPEATLSVGQRGLQWVGWAAGWTVWSGVGWGGEGRWRR